jgi:hypothetical protein
MSAGGYLNEQVGPYSLALATEHLLRVNIPK